MSDLLTERQTACLIIPFAYEHPYADCGQQLDPSLYTPKNIGADRLYDYAQYLVAASDERPETIGRRWVLEQRARKVYGLPNSHQQLLTCTAKGQSWAFGIQGMELYLFETQVGFVLLRLSFPSGMPIAEMIEALYYLKKLRPFGHGISFEQRLSRTDSSIKEVDLSRLVTELLEPIKPSTYFEGGEKTPSEALVYSAVLLDATTEEIRPALGTYMFRMRRSFKSSYKAAEAEGVLESHPDVLQPFANSCWGLSLEGLANIVWKTEDEEADRFFNSNYLHSIESTYTYLYVLALHQKYALLYYTIQASRLPGELAVLESVVQQNERLTSFRTELARFMLRSSYQQVSRMTHHAAWYAWIRERLQIDRLFVELQESLTALSSLTDLAELKLRQAADARNREQMDRFNKKITGITAIFLPLSVAMTLYSMNTEWVKVLQGISWSFPAVAGGLYVLTLLLFRFWLNR